MARTDNRLRRSRRLKDNLLKAAIWLSTALTVGVLLLILGYILIKGVPNISWSFLTDIYRESNNQKGILPMIINTAYLVVMTLAVAVPTGIAAAIYLTQYARQGRFVRIIRFTTETLAGIPSIIYGLFGFALFVSFLDLGYSLLAGALTLAIMVLPTMIRTTEEALLAVPGQYREGALALGAGNLRVILGMILPSAMPGIVTAVILSVGRIVGESAALMFTAGLVTNMPGGLFSHALSSGRSLTLHLYQLAMRGEDLGQTFATASVLLLIVFVLNRLAKLLARLVSKN
ncbi:MAG TPA: phosphate ABC transporter permease PtsA [Clostridiales bacterium]|nr:phosphate ABC transporter permease PtsA [Clostridiales bacterium]